MSKVPSLDPSGAATCIRFARFVIDAIPSISHRKVNWYHR